MKANVYFIVKDWKESWEGREITRLMKSMPGDNVIETPDEISSDMDIMISCPQSFASKLRDTELVTWIMDFGTFDEYEGFCWDGKKLQVIYKGKLISMEEWEEIVESILND